MKHIVTWVLARLKRMLSRGRLANRDGWVPARDDVTRIVPRRS